MQVFENVQGVAPIDVCLKNDIDLKYNFQLACTRCINNTHNFCDIGVTL